jgi:hypothetical protein
MVWRHVNNPAHGGAGSDTTSCRRVQPVILREAQRSTAQPQGVLGQSPDPNFAAIARSHGARAATMRTLTDLAPVKAWVAEGAPGVFVIDGDINPDLEADWHVEHFP